MVRGRALYPLQGVIFALSGSAAAELLLRHFLQVASELSSSVARAGIVALTLYTIQRFALGTLPVQRQNRKDLLTLTGVLLVFVVIEWLGRIVRLSIAAYSHGSSWVDQIDPAAVYFAMPYAAGALLLQVILGLRFSLVFGVSLATIVGTYSPSDFVVFPFVLVTALIACLNVTRVRSRSAYFNAGVHIFAASCFFAVASAFSGEDPSTTELAVRVMGAGIGGILCTLIALGFTPVVEYLGGYVTDLRLIELATLDHPLLKELSVQAPGTWNHSTVMGMMTESAADAVGANSVLARVACYFHDIGKTKKPLYFVENQLDGENRHDKLSPSMSALIIKAHVKDGLELGRKHKLPLAIQDMIAQHHGTSVIEYFYDKALKEAESQGEGGTVDRGLYTYPGPKPQTKEAGILMLADGIEAASRTLSEPTADRIQGMVQKMINKVFASGQLSECDLTLSDLHLIAKSFTRVLTSIYHQRVSYSEPAEKVNQGGKDGKEDAKKEVGSVSSGKTTSQQGEQDRTKTERQENLKRLGM